MNAHLLVLSCLIDLREAYENLIEKLDPRMFFGEMKEAFLMIRDIRSKSTGDQVSYAELYSRGLSVDLLSKLGNYPVTEGSYCYRSYFNALLTEYNTGRIYDWMNRHEQITENEVNDLIDLLAEMKTGHENGYSRKTLEIAKDAEKQIRARQDPGYSHPYTSDLSSYDRLGNFERGYLVILAGGSGHGKSTFALSLAYRYLRKGLRVAYFTYEMSDVICLSVLTCIHTGIPWDRVFYTKGEKMSDIEFEEFLNGLDEVKLLPLTISETVKSPTDIRQIILSDDIDVFIVDTVNYLIESGDRFWLDLANLSNKYKDLARECKCLGIVLAQRDSSTGRPKNKDILAMSRHMKDAADVIDLLYREAEDNLMCPEILKSCLEVYRVKGRFTGRGNRYLYFDAATKEIRDLKDWEEARIREEIRG